MENHVKFLAGEQRRYLSRIQKTSGLKVDKLAEIAKVSPRNFRDWKNEKLSIRTSVAVDYSSKFNILLPEKVEVMESRWKKLKRKNGRIGGISCFRKHGSPGTTEGRKKGGSKAIRILMEKGIIPPIKTFNDPGKGELFAEFIGILLGDGGITNGQVIVTLNSKADKDYAWFVSDLESKLFAEKPKFYFKKDCNAVSVYLNGKNLVNMLQGYGLKIGNKVRQQVDVPPWIKDSPEFKLACLRGLMDTDGGVFIHKYKVNGKLYQYKKICFTNRSVPLLIFVKSVLEELGFTPKIITKIDNKKVWLYNSEEVRQYLKVVGSSNKRLARYNSVL